VKISDSGFSIFESSDMKQLPHLLRRFAGTGLSEIKKQDYTWFFGFWSNLQICTEGSRRLISLQGVVVTSQDHDRKFGRPSTIDAAARAAIETQNKKINDCQVADFTSDLSLFFDDGIQLQFLSLSSGYQSWRASDGTAEVVCQGGGNIVVFEGKN